MIKNTIEANKQYYRETVHVYDMTAQPFVHQGLFLSKILSGFSIFSNGSRFLDFGCGTDSSTRLLVNCFPDAQVAGIDVSADMLKVAAAKVPEALFCLYDGLKIPFNDGYFDGVLASSVVHHIFDYDAALIEIIRVCKKKSWIIITEEPNPRINKIINVIRKLIGQNIPQLLQDAEYHQFRRGGIHPEAIKILLRDHDFSCKIIYNNDALLDMLIHKYKTLYRMGLFMRKLNLPIVCLSYNVLALREI